MFAIDLLEYGRRELRNAGIESANLDARILFAEAFDLKERFQTLFSLTKTNNMKELDYFLQKIKKKGKLEQNFLKLGFNINKDYHKIIKGLNEQRLKNNPVKVSISDIQHILKNF